MAFDFFTLLVIFSLLFICFRLYQKTKKQEIQKSESAAVPPITQLRDGWVSSSVGNLLLRDSVQASYKALEASTSTWQDSCTQEWFLSFQNLSKVRLMEIGMHVSQIEDKNEVERIKQCITIGSFLFGYAVPVNLFSINENSLSNVLLYKILTKPVRVDYKEYNLDPSYWVNDFESVIKTLLKLPVVASVFNAGANPCNVFLLKSSIDKIKPGLLVDLIALKKAMTALYLTNHPWIPLDYLYLDVQVFDYIDTQTSNTITSSSIASESA